MAYSLRPYQEKAVNTVGEALGSREQSGVSSGIHAMATGLGKTVVSVATTDRYFHPRDKHRSLFAGGVNRELVFQGLGEYHAMLPELRGKFYDGKNYRRGSGIVMGDISNDDAYFIVASMPTLVEKIPASGLISVDGKPLIPEDEPIEARDFFRDKDGGVHLSPLSKRRFLITPRLDKIYQYGPLSNWIHDEAHHSVSGGALAVFSRLNSLHNALDIPLIFNIGNTATPNRADKVGLHNVYETVFSSYDIFWGIAHGYLAPLLQPQRLTVGEAIESNDSGYEAEISDVGIKAVDNWADMIIKGWKDMAYGRPTMVYIGKMNDMPAIEASKYLAHKFNEAGITAAHLDNSTCIGPDGIIRPESARQDIFDLYKQGHIKVLVNYGVLIEGVNLPLTSCIMLARKVNELQFTQIIGRGLRLFHGDEKLKLPPKDGLLFIDTTGQSLVIDTLATIIGYTIDPADKKRIILDPAMVQDLMQQVMDAWYDLDKQARIKEWSKIQNKYQKETLERAIKKALGMKVDKATPTDCSIYRLIIEIAYSEDEILAAMDMKGEEKLVMTNGKTTRFSEVEIGRATKNDWKFGSLDGIAALQVSEDVALVILRPNLPAYNRVMKMKNWAQERLVDSSKVTGHLLLDKGTPDFLESFENAMEVYSTLFGKYTLWHVTLIKKELAKSYVKTPENAPKDRDGRPYAWFVQSESDLWEMTIAASKYAFERTEVTEDFISKNASWKTQTAYGEPLPSSKGQIFMLGKLGYNGAEGQADRLSKAEASRIITHMAATPSVRAAQQQRLEEVAKLWKLGKSLKLS